MGELSRGWGQGGPTGSPQLGLGRCRFWEEIRGSWLEPSPKVKNMPVLEGPVGQGGQNVARVVVGWISGNRTGAWESLSFWSCTWGTKDSLKPGLAYTWRSPAARGPMSILECKMWALEVPQRPASPVPSLHRAQRGSEACPRSHSQPTVELSPQIPYKPDTGSQISAWNSAFSYLGFA